MFLTSLAMQGLIGITSNPVLANGIAGLATSATAQATIEVRHSLESVCAFLLLILYVRHLASRWRQPVYVSTECYIFCAVGLNGVRWAQRFLLWERRNNTVSPFNETVQQVFARISALRDSLDGPQVIPCLLCSLTQSITDCSPSNMDLKAWHESGQSGVILRQVLWHQSMLES